MQQERYTQPVLRGLVTSEKAKIHAQTLVSL